MNNRGWIGVDFDGTLAEYGKTPFEVLGDPIPSMVQRVKDWLAQGENVKIFTARVSHPDTANHARIQITQWCIEHIGIALEVTCIKDFAMIELWDDRAIQVIHNTGEPIRLPDQFESDADIIIMG